MVVPFETDMDRPFSEELIRIRDHWHVKNHPLFLDWRDGKLELRHMGLYMTQHQHHVEGVLRHYGHLLTKAHPDAKHFLLDNLAEEEGLIGGGDGEREAVHHKELVYRFTRHCGISDEEARATEVMPAWRARTSHAIRVMYEEPAEVFMASISISESQEVGQNAERTIPGFLEHYGFSHDAPEIGFFTEHELADEVHGSRQVGYAEKYITSEDERSHALELAWTFGQLKWFSIDQVYDWHVLGNQPRLPGGNA